MTSQRASEPSGSAPLRILYHHRIGSKDGQGVHVASLIAALRRQGHQVEIAAPPVFERADFGGQAHSLTRLRRAVPQFAYELLEIAYNAPVLWRLSRACRRLRPHFIYERYNLLLVAGVLWARLHRIPVFLEVNSPLAAERAEFAGLAFSGLAAWLERLTWRAADLVLPVSRVLADTVRGAGVPDERIVVIPNGIDEESFRLLDGDAAKSALGLGGKTVLGFVGFVREWHGLDAVLDLLADTRCPADLHLLVVGDGPALPALRSRVQRHGLSGRVSFAGLVKRTEVARYIAAFDVALQPRSVTYASPLKIFEYMASGKAIVAPNQENIREILVEGETARLFTPDDDGAFRAAVFDLAAHPALRARLAANARQAIGERRYRWADNAERIVELFRRLDEQRRPRPAVRVDCSGRSRQDRVSP